METTKAAGFFLAMIAEEGLPSRALEGGGVEETGICITTCFPTLPDVLLLPSSSSPDSWGEMKRAVGLGPEFEGPRDFFKMGCGQGAGALELDAAPEAVECV